MPSSRGVKRERMSQRLLMLRDGLYRIGFEKEAAEVGEH
jgi:hypothetical protein